MSWLLGFLTISFIVLATSVAATVMWMVLRYFGLVGFEVRRK